MKINHRRNLISMLVLTLSSILLSAAVLYGADYYLMGEECLDSGTCADGSLTISGKGFPRIFTGVFDFEMYSGDIPYTPNGDHGDYEERIYIGIDSDGTFHSFVAVGQLQAVESNSCTTYPLPGGIHTLFLQVMRYNEDARRNEFVVASPTIVIDGDSMLELDYSEIEWISEDDFDNGTPLPVQRIGLESYDSPAPDPNNTPQAHPNSNENPTQSSGDDSSGGGCFIHSLYF